MTESMVDLLHLYQMEDEAYNAVVEATTEFYQYLLQPFRDMRELAMLRRQQIKVIGVMPVQSGLVISVPLGEMVFYTWSSEAI